VTALPSTGHPPGLARHEGWNLFTAAQALLKGVLEADTSVELIAGPRSEPFAPVLALDRDETVAALLEHRAVSGKRALALVPNAELDRTAPVIGRVGGPSLERGGAVCVVLEDDPLGCPSACPRRTAVALDLPCLQPASVEQLRDAVEQALRLSRAARRPAAMVVHRWILRSAETLEARPNRVMEPAAAVVAPPRRRGRWAETGGVLRVARRLELNRIRSMPSPGEHLPVGFVVAGPAAAAIDHVIDLLRLHGRVPVLQLGLVHPFDDSVVQRMLGRCEKVVVLEPRPRALEPDILRAAEAIRRRGERTAAIYTRALDDEPSQAGHFLQPNEALHPSILARRIVHLLHAIRPGLEIPFVPDPPTLAAPPAPRGELLGPAAALALIRETLADVDQWLRDQAPAEASQTPLAAAPTALVIDGSEPEGLAAGQRVVAAETWSYRRFLDEGVGSLQQAAWDDRPWMFVVCAVGADNAHDLERLARGALPGERAEGVRIEIADLNERGRLRDLLRSLTQSVRLSVVIVCDGPPPRFDVIAMERARAEIDRLGYEPRQRVVGPMEQLGAIRQSPELAPPKPPLEPDPTPLRTQLTVGRLSKTRRAGGQFRLRVRPLLESVEVVRDRPPASAWMPTTRSGARIWPGSGGRGRAWRPGPCAMRAGPWATRCAASMIRLRSGRAAGHGRRSCSPSRAATRRRCPSRPGSPTGRPICSWASTIRRPCVRLIRRGPCGWPISTARAPSST
jgi:hypothetical protein